MIQTLYVSVNRITFVRLTHHKNKILSRDSTCRANRRDMPIDYRLPSTEEGHRQSHAHSGQEGFELDPPHSAHAVQLRATFVSSIIILQQNDCSKLPCTFTIAPETNSNDFVFLELIGRFESDFRRCEMFFERFEFLVCSKFNHMQQDCTCACAVACLHDDIYKNIYQNGRSKALSTEHHGKCLTCKAFVILVSVSLSLSLCLSVSVSVCCVLLSWWSWWRREV